MNGIIVWCNRSGTYGFVRPVDGGPDIAFRVDDATAARMPSIEPGMAVHCLVRHDDLGPLAHHLAPGHLDGESL